MFHAVDLVVNEATGVPMADVKVRLFDPVTSAAVPIYADESATPFAEANTALTDKSGLYDFWVADGIWDQKFYVGEALLSSIPKLAFTGTLASQAEAEAGTDNVKIMTSLRVAQAIAGFLAGFSSGTVAFTLPDEADGDTIPAPGSGLPYLSAGVMKIA